MGFPDLPYRRSSYERVEYAALIGSFKRDAATTLGELRDQLRETPADVDRMAIRGALLLEEAFHLALERSYEKCYTLCEVARQDLNQALLLNSPDPHTQFYCYLARYKSWRLSAMTWQALGNAAQARKELNQARETLVVALSIQRSPNLVNLHGILECRLGNYETALDLVREAIEQMPTNMLFIAHRGLVLYHLGLHLHGQENSSHSRDVANSHYQAAIRDFTQAIDHDRAAESSWIQLDNEQWIYVFRSLCYYALARDTARNDPSDVPKPIDNDWERAKEDLLFLKEAYPDSPFALFYDMAEWLEILSKEEREEFLKFSEKATLLLTDIQDMQEFPQSMLKILNKPPR